MVIYNSYHLSFIEVWCGGVSKISSLKSFIEYMPKLHAQSSIFMSYDSFTPLPSFIEPGPPQKLVFTSEPMTCGMLLRNWNKKPPPTCLPSGRLSLAGANR
jgi:hypothetical protein